MECVVFTSASILFIALIVLWSKVSALASRVNQLENDLRLQTNLARLAQQRAMDAAKLTAAERTTPLEETPAPVVPVTPPPVTPVPDEPFTPPVTGSVSADEPVAPLRSEPIEEPVEPAAPPAPAAPPKPREPDWVDNLITAVKRWFTEGNVPVKIGMLVLFAGVAALLKYATDQGWLNLPIELRLTAVAAAAIAGLVFGWKERARRRAFGLSLQGGAIGILLMTVFAAFRLYQLIPAPAAFALMVLLVMCAGILAVAQDAVALAVLGITAGFAAPILISTGSGNHVALFTFYTVLNLAIFAISWKKQWRVLNLLGFTFTFVVGTAWGVLKYQQEQFESTEPFLIGFFLIYLAIPVITALKSEKPRTYVDASLIFANPLLTFALQAGLLKGEPMPLAYSGLALAIIYAGLAWWLMPRARPLAETLAVLGVGFATLAVPLAFSARATACTFALEGAALVWFGLRNNRRLPRWSGIVLQLCAAWGFLYALYDRALPADSLAVLNGGFISAFFLATAAFVIASMYAARNGKSVAVVMYLWGVMWWAVAGLREISRFVPHEHSIPATLAFFAFSAAVAAQFFTWFREPSKSGEGGKFEGLAWTTAVALAFCVIAVFAYGNDHLEPWSPGGLAGLAAFAGFGFFALHRSRDATTPALGLGHSNWVWAWVLALAVTFDQLSMNESLGEGWRFVLPVVPVLLAWLVLLAKPYALAPPLGSRFEGWRGFLTGTFTIAVACLFVMTLFQAGGTEPITFVPLLNPVELLQLLVLFGAARWLASDEAPAAMRERRVVLLAIMAFSFITSATLRGVHHLGDVPWDDELSSSMVAQTSLTVVWSILGVAGWIFGSRRPSRPVWLAGAVLMAVVLAKLLLIDRTHLGSAFGIISFIAYGLLCTAIGYFAPAPPRESAPVSGEKS